MGLSINDPELGSIEILKNSRELEDFINERIEELNSKIEKNNNKEMKRWLLNDGVDYIFRGLSIINGFTINDPAFEDLEPKLLNIRALSMEIVDVIRKWYGNDE